MTAMGNQHREFIVDRNEGAEVHGAVSGRDHGVEGEDELVDAVPLITVFKDAFRGVMDTVFGWHDIQNRGLAGRIPEASDAFWGFRAVLGQAAMDPVEMRGIEVA